MTNADDLVKQAVSVFKAGRKAEARTILEGVVEKNEGHAEAWLYLSALVDSLEEQEICLENVLALDPANEKARKGLETVRQKMASQQNAAPPSGTEFEAVSSDNPFGDPPAEPQMSFGSEADLTPPPEQVYDWFSPTPPAAEPAPEPDPYTIPTSVDWGNADKPATYGSGQNVEMPSAQEWDSWVQGLNIAKEQSEEPASPAPADAIESGVSPFVMDDDDAPFGQTAYMVDDDDTELVEAAPVEDDSDPFGSEPFGSPSPWATPFGDEVADEDHFAEDETFPPAEEPGSAPSAFGAGLFESSNLHEGEEEAPPMVSAFTYDALEAEIVEGVSVEEESVEEELVFNFDGDDEDDDLGIEPAPESKAASRLGAEYFRLIPGEIEAKAGGSGPRAMMMVGGIVVLAVLNVISFALLLL